MAKKVPSKSKEKIEESEEMVEEAQEDGAKGGEHKARQKPKLSPSAKRSLSIRNKRAQKKPAFRRQEWFRYTRVKENWRRPRGMHSKFREHLGYRPQVVSIGFGSPKEARGMHRSGFMEVLVHRPADLDKLNPELQAARIAHGVGTKKRNVIQERADELGIRVLNRRE